MMEEGSEEEEDVEPTPGVTPASHVLTQLASEISQTVTKPKKNEAKKSADKTNVEIIRVMVIHFMLLARFRNSFRYNSDPAAKAINARAISLIKNNFSLDSSGISFST